LVSEEKIKSLIDTDVNIILSSHGGFVNLSGIERDGKNTRVILEFYGGCSGCPSSFTFTLKMIETFLRKELKDENIIVENIENL